MDYLRHSGQQVAQDTFVPPHVLLLDLNMPKKDGRTALAEIRADPALSDLPIIVVTTSTARRDKEYCTQYDILDYVNKPTTMDELHWLMQIIKRVCTSQFTPRVNGY